MTYKLRWSNGSHYSASAGKIVCVGRNYAAHAKELNNPIPTEPLLFMKPSSSLVDLASPIKVSEDFGVCHFETELALLIGKRLSVSVNTSPAISSTELLSTHVVGVGLALDITRRELQDKLKAKGHPWEIAKSFDGACPISSFVAADKVSDWDQLGLRLQINGKLQQQGFAKEMIAPLEELLIAIRKHFSLEPGDIVLTGTPAGVGPLQVGMRLELELLQGQEILLQQSTSVV